MDKNRPVKTFNGGRIHVAIWENKGTSQRTWFSVSSSRSYVDEHGTWRDSNGFAPHDLPLLCRLLDQAYDYLYSLQCPRENGDQRDEGLAEYDAPPEACEVPAEPA